jgi:hypothetical protein
MDEPLNLPEPMAVEAPLSFEAKVLRAFIRDGRLVTIPAAPKKRQVVLRYLAARCFPDDRVYPEPEVNERLSEYNEDVAALRRYMVIAGLMTRACGEYRRG